MRSFGLLDCMLGTYLVVNVMTPRRCDMGACTCGLSVHFDAPQQIVACLTLQWPMRLVSEGLLGCGLERGAAAAGRQLSQCLVKLQAADMSRAFLHFLKSPCNVLGWVRLQQTGMLPSAARATESARAVEPCWKEPCSDLLRVDQSSS